MTPGRVEARRRWFLSNRKMKRNPANNAGLLAMHQRGYHKGDIRCVKCMKWINPNDPREASEILVTPSGKRMHATRFCSNGPRRGGAPFAMVSRHGTSRRKRLDEFARY